MLTIIVPYRDRPEQLAKFLGRFQALGLDYKLVIAQQADDKPFNRGLLLNAGYLESPQSDYYCMHDVDMLPTDRTAYNTYPFAVTQLASSKIQPFHYLGGVTVFHRAAFEWLNGYPNDFGRAEDNAVMFALMQYRIDRIESFQEFDRIEHPRPKQEFDPEAWSKAKTRNPRANGVWQSKYHVVSRLSHQNGNLNLGIVT